MNPSLPLPESLRGEADNAWSKIIERATVDEAVALQQAWNGGPHAAELPLMLATSPFVLDTGRRRPALLSALLHSGDLSRSLAADELNATLAALLDEAGADLHAVLRHFRQRHMLRIIWRDFTRRADTPETTRDTSLLAEACLIQAQRVLAAELEARYGRPIGRHSGAAQQLLVIAMGKLGARELNVSSDIDLIFVYPEAGQTDGDRGLSNEEFFIKLGQRLIAALDQVTADGFVFRVDMRLRPYGDSGALVHNFAALEEYYQDQGRDWERYAMIKGRPVTGNPARAQELEAALRPFIYRRYIDFGVIESLRSMKQMISAEERRRALQDNVKLGRGGIREVEFIAQCFQLIRGGRDIELQQRELISVLDQCAKLNCLPREAVNELQQAYFFLRDTEHAIQGYADQQTQELPVADLPRAALVHVMGFAGWDSFHEELTRQRGIVAGHFDNLIAPPEDESGPGGQVDHLWSDELDEAALAALGFLDPRPTLEALLELRESRRIAVLQAEGRQRVETFMPKLIRACAESSDPDIALVRILPLVIAVLRRSAYLALLSENPPALAELVTLCCGSPWIAEKMAAEPVLLDELLDRASLYTAPDKDLLQSELQQQVARLSPTDLEEQMNALRYFKASHVLRVAASELAGRLPLKKVSDKLTYIAEVILDQCIAVAWADLTARYGQPSREDGATGTGFTVLGYGKLGGIELSYSSDLDLVFIYDAKKTGVTDGQRSIDNSVFYTRLGQRIIHIMETRMPQGQLYEVDMRLRPSGESGMLVATLTGFEQYQQEAAWTWEHQALVRARYVAGDPVLAGRVESIRRATLCRKRDTEALAREVSNMRERMRQHLLPSEEPRWFALKQGSGGIVDIEFLVQFSVLGWSYQYPALALWSDNVRILEALGEAELLPADECVLLTEAYLAYRSAAHQLALQQAGDQVAADGYADRRAVVRRHWHALLPAPTVEAE